MREYVPDTDFDFADEFLGAATHFPGHFGMPGVRVSFPDLPDKPEVALFRLEHLTESRLLGELLLEEIEAAGTPQRLRISLQVDGGDFRGRTEWNATLELKESDGRIFVMFDDFSGIWRRALEEEKHQLKPPVLKRGATFRGESGTAYLVGEELGHGGTAVVHRVHSYERSLAAKCLRPDRFPLSQLVPRFEREVNYLSQVKHPNVLGFIDRCMTDENLVLVTELAEESLAARLLKEPPAPQEALDWIRQVLAGLSHLHERGITHRDLSPKNVLVAEDGTLKLADFGTVRAISDPDLTNDLSEIHLGSLLFISDQQRRDPHGAQPSDDIFAAGQIAYLLVTGAIPFGNPPQLSDLKIVSPAASAAIESMRAHRREDRYKDGGAALEALEAAAS
jgi:hypothetical protein